LDHDELIVHREHVLDDRRTGRRLIAAHARRGGADQRL
jgi:hypothetical protein